MNSITKFVCNAGPVIALAKIDHLSVLKEVARRVEIPESVLHEVVAKPGLDAERILEASRTWLTAGILPERIDPAVEHSTRKLDVGERDVIILAQASKRPVVALLDDAAGRRVARELGIPTIGFVGTLLLAKKRQTIVTVAPLLFEARAKGYWLSDELISEAKRLANE